MTHSCRNCFRCAGTRREVATIHGPRGASTIVKRLCRETGLFVVTVGLDINGSCCRWKERLSNEAIARKANAYAGKNRVGVIAQQRQECEGDET